MEAGGENFSLQKWGEKWRILKVWQESNEPYNLAQQTIKTFMGTGWTNNSRRKNF